MFTIDPRILNINRELLNVLENHSEVLAAWEGGAAATGFYDEFSDLDLTIVISSDDVEPVFGWLQEFLSQNYGIISQFRMPEPCWHGMSQCFYHIKGMPEYFYCDIAVVKADNPNKFTEPDRHGNAVIWFDRIGIYKAEPTSPEELEALGKRMFRTATETAFLGIIELKKALARKNWHAAQMNYTMFLYRHLVVLMNLKYRPEKADFGLRYSERDYPPEAANQLGNYLRVSSLQDIERHLSSALPLFHELQTELRVIYSQDMG